MPLASAAPAEPAALIPTEGDAAVTANKEAAAEQHTKIWEWASGAPRRWRWRWRWR